MKNYYIYPYKNDLNLNNNIIMFNNLDEYFLKNKLKKEILFSFNQMNITKNSHIFIVGLGNDNHTADSIGPKTLKHIKVNSFLENIGIKIKANKVSALEPGVLGETGILTHKIISSVSKEIKPDLIILIDSFVSDDINYLNKSIEINNIGINPGSGIKGISSEINKDTFNIPILVIGVVTAVEIKFSNEDKNFIPYLLSTKDIDEFVINISKIIGEAINEAIDGLV